METPDNPTPQSLEQTTVLPAAQLPTTDELPVVRAEAPPAYGPAPKRSSAPLLRAIAAGAIVGVALIGVLLFVTSSDGDDVTTQTIDEQAEATSAAELDDGASQASAEPTAASESARVTTGEAGHWQVVGVPDRLNVRAGPGTNNDVLGSLANEQRHVAGTGRRAALGGSEWIEVVYDDDGATGWVSGRFLTADVAPDAAPVEPTPNTQAPANSSRVCFASSGDPQELARIDFSNHTEISGLLLTLDGTAVVAELSGTLVDGQAAITLTDAAGQSTTEQWNFGPASIQSSSRPALAVVDCASIAGEFG